MTAIGTLRTAQGDGAERTFELVSDVVLGRDTSADIVLTDPSGEVSRRHARIVIRGTEAVLEDLGSSNGTFVNGERLDGPYALRAGDKVEARRVHARVRARTRTSADALQKRRRRHADDHQRVGRGRVDDAARQCDDRP